jgi:hypothetical protein
MLGCIRTEISQTKVHFAGPSTHRALGVFYCEQTMNRPIYETEDDLSNERRVANLLERKWKCNLVKLQPRDEFDFAAVREDTVTGFVEVKHRQVPTWQYPNYFISMKKILAAHQTFQATGIAVVLAVQFNDALGFTAISSKKYPVKMGGRYDRGDPQDVEPVSFIPLADFTLIKTD